MTDAPFLAGVPAEYVTKRLQMAGGKEIESGKLASAESSAALACNCFGWFIERPGELPSFPGLSQIDWPATMVDVEYCARFPWPGGRHPWLDAVVQTDQWLIGVESKRFEPFRDKKKVSLSDAYDRPVWGEHMAPFEHLRDDLRSGEEEFVFLDAVQLVKHAFGLVTDARRLRRRPALVYLFAEPPKRGETIIPQQDIRAHRAEIERFRSCIESAEVAFAACSYREWIGTWESPAVTTHGEALLQRFNP